MSAGGQSFCQPLEPATWSSFRNVLSRAHSASPAAPASMTPHSFHRGRIAVDKGAGVPLEEIKTRVLVRTTATIEGYADLSRAALYGVTY